MCALNQSLAKLLRAGRISYEACLEVSPDTADLQRCPERRERRLSGADPRES